MERRIAYMSPENSERALVANLRRCACKGSPIIWDADGKVWQPGDHDTLVKIRCARCRRATSLAPLTDALREWDYLAIRDIDA